MTNGKYTYAIIKFAQVAATVPGNIFSSIGFEKNSNAIIYTVDKTILTDMFNSNTPGTYIFDLNGR